MSGTAPHVLSKRLGKGGGATNMDALRVERESEIIADQVRARKRPAYTQSEEDMQQELSRAHEDFPRLCGARLVGNRSLRSGVCICMGRLRQPWEHGQHARPNMRRRLSEWARHGSNSAEFGPLNQPSSGSI